ncbi:MAG TPA: hypothetical protein VFW98_17545 [Gemmatimonadaceae bacterium]|nr:hypothetical protein [Gemmatimonadaceae bacterium]
MASTNSFLKFTDIAVFSRNYPKYLEAASGKAPDERVTFRSGVRWVRAAQAISRFGPRRIYFAPNGAGSHIEYEADLVTIQLDPSDDDSTTRKLLKDVLPCIRHEELWNGSVRTPYVIMNCRQVATPFPQTRLHKESDGSPLAENFSRSYALVRELRADDA